MTESRVLARNALLNLAGQLLPLIVALLAIPPLVAGLDRERFGVLTLAWATIGYFAIFDLGLGRVLTHEVATRRAAGGERESDLSAVVWTTLALMMLLGIAGTVLLATLAPWLVVSVLDVPPGLRDEAVRAFWVLSLALPFVVSTAALRGLLEAHQRFGLLNALRVPLALLTYLGPLLVLPFSRRLVPIVGVLVAGRIVTWMAHVLVCRRAYTDLRTRPDVRRNLVRPLLQMGGWMTVTNVVSPLMVYFDRFVIGAVLSVTAVAYYVTPYELVTKLFLIPGALLGVLFPAFAATSVGDLAATARLMDRGARVLVLTMLPPVAVLVAVAPEVLTLWVGAEFAREGALVLQWLAIGVFVNSVGQVAHTALLGVGRADLPGKLHLAELPAYAALLWWLAGNYGITGVAIAWTVRVAIDATVLYALAARHVAAQRGSKMLVIAVTLPALGLIGMMTMSTATTRLTALVVGMLLFAGAGWRLLLSPVERTALLAFVRAPIRRVAAS